MKKRFTPYVVTIAIAILGLALFPVPANAGVLDGTVDCSGSQCYSGCWRGSWIDTQIGELDRGQLEIAVCEYLDTRQAADIRVDYNKSFWVGSSIRVWIGWEYTYSDGTYMGPTYMAPNIISMNRGDLKGTSWLYSTVPYYNCGTECRRGIMYQYDDNGGFIAAFHTKVSCIEH